MALIGNFTNTVSAYGGNPAPTISQSFIAATRALAQAALDYWATLIAPSATFNITLNFVDIPGNYTLANASPNWVALTQPSGPNLGLYEHAAGFVLRHGVSSGLTFDFAINIDVPNFQAAYYDNDLSTSSDIQGYDAFSTLVHEIGHGLGFLGPNTGPQPNTITDNQVLAYGTSYFVGENVTMNYGIPNGKYGILTDYDPNFPGSGGHHYETGVMFLGAVSGVRPTVTTMELSWLADLGIGTVNNDILRGVEAAGYNDEVIDGGAGNDLIYGSSGKDTLIGGSGIDTVDFSDSPDWVAVDLLNGFGMGGHAQEDTFSGIENVRGSSFNDLLFGDGGANRLRGGLGSDYLEGRGGADVYVFDTPLSAANNVDAIGNFLSGTAKIELSSAIFNALAPGSLQASAFGTGATATSASQRILFNQADGALYYDPDGSGAAAAVKFAIISYGASVVASDFLIV